VDQKTIRYIDAWGRQFDGAVKAVDAENSTITVDEKGAETTWPVTKDARIRIDGKEPCKLADLPTGAVVNVALSVDQKTVRSIDARGPQLGGGVKAADAEKNTLTVARKEGETTFPVAKDAVIVVDGKPGKLAGILKEASVNMTLSADQKTARRIDAEGPTFGGVVKAVDAEKNTLTVARKEDETTFPVAKDARIRIDGKEPCRLADLPTGARVNVTLSVDQKTARRIDAEGPPLGTGAVKAVDAEKNTLTFDDQAPANVAGKTFPVAKDARIRIDGKEPNKLTDLPTGTRVNVTLCVDQQTIHSIDAQGPVSGVVTAVDAEKRTLTVALKEGESTFSVAEDATIEIDGKPSTLAGLSKGTFVTLSKFAGQTAVRSIQAKGQ
jgi:hypothetical protein